MARRSLAGEKMMFHPEHQWDNLPYHHMSSDHSGKGDRDKLKEHF